MLAFEMSRDDIRAAVRGTAFVDETEAGLSPIRLPHSIRQRGGDESIERMAAQTAGVRLEVLTTASVVAIEAVLTRSFPAAVPDDARPAVLVAVVDGRETDRKAFLNGPILRQLDAGRTERIDGAVAIAELSLGEPATRPRVIEIWLPQVSATEIHRVSADAPLHPSPTRARPRWTHYGSSISHSAEADGPTRTWPALAALALDWDLTNLGFGGQAMIDPFVARVIRDRPSELITLKIGTNPINADALRMRTFVPAVHGFLDTIRDGQPDTPVVVISPVALPMHETTPGPTVVGPDGHLTGTPDAGDRPGVLTLSYVRPTLERIVGERADPAMHYLDGRRLLGPDDTHHLHDRLHPDAEGYVLMGDRFVQIARHAVWAPRNPGE
ncbi:GDSL-type esterase/lipase family protein [Herbiconiux ginsengi]|uniref:GDSL-like Lipase/Acylhydrolase family protein n=1 Tax=Herbiconiux ginsengi TaxID=381665 RepID=A0A1H3K6Y5_9MICO|nr:GDSL-type esterase/lipase family protein [Herbiconiux ginsengi]SDY47936.1 GDSL-like Lipase/Acylhydrolase family protein [Herbiconiux ginsengi]